MSWQRVQAEFDALVDQSEPARSARLRELETTDPSLAASLRTLLRHDGMAAGFLERTGPGGGDSGAAVAPAAGQQLGRFRLEKPLGIGGMGTVWAASQTDPHRRVAIKLVARSEHSEAARWRFQHEVEVLALLNHPAIATFYEAGTAELDGTEVAWFAMELVEGAVDMLTWADRQRLAEPQRLALFLRLCDAVEYGHRCGVLHRDLKPSNVLVGSDGQLKLIDFGIARALGSFDAAAIARTQTGEVVGTLQFMAPEQLRGQPAAINAACDVYALGVLLYHLLCGCAPFDFSGVPLATIAQRVLEEEPLAPTKAEPKLPLELGWILLRALEKDPARRYATVVALVLDLQRFLAHEPVHAHPPGLAYRLRKFGRRHRLAVAIVTTLVIGLGIGTFGLLRGIEKAREGELAALQGMEVSRGVSTVLVRLFDGIQDTAASREMKVHELLSAAKDDPVALADPLVEATVRHVRGTIYSRLRRFPEARTELERAYELHQGQRSMDPDLWRDENLRLEAGLGRVLMMVGERERGEALLRNAVAAVDDGATDVLRVAVLHLYCSQLASDNRMAELATRAAQVAELARRTGNMARAVEGDAQFAMAASSLGRHDQALPAAERAWQAARQNWGDDNAMTSSTLRNHVLALQEAGQIEAADALYPQLIDNTRRVFGSNHPDLLMVLTNHASLLVGQGKRTAAIVRLREIVQCYDLRGTAPDRNHLAALHNLGQSLSSIRQFEEAEPILARTAKLTRTVLTADDIDGALMRFNHGACLAWMKRWTEAEPVLLAEHEALVELLPEGHDNLGKLRRTIADAYRANGFPEQAAKWRAR